MLDKQDLIDIAKIVKNEKHSLEATYNSLSGKLNVVYYKARISKEEIDRMQELYQKIGREIIERGINANT